MIKITDNIYCITTHCYGRKFNSYLICGEKNALVDSCPEEYSDKLIEKVKEKVGSLDYVFFTHTDRMRAGAVELLSDSTIIATIAGLRNLKEIANKELSELPAKDGDEFDLGGISMKILITPNLNWPDTMMLYIPQEKLLLSGTAFVGYNDSMTVEEYCVNEMRLFSEFALIATKKAAQTGAEIICPSEGDIQENDVFQIYCDILKKHHKPLSAAVIYAGTESGYTAQLVQTAAHTMCEAGFNVISVNAVSHSRDEAVKIMNSADALCFASPTIHRNAVPEIIDVIARLDCVNMRHKPCMVVGSYGWGGEALGTISNMAKVLKLRVFEKPFGCIMKPSKEKNDELTDFTKRFVEFAKGIYNDNK